MENYPIYFGPEPPPEEPAPFDHEDQPFDDNPDRA